MDWKTMLTYISGSVDEELLLRNEYLVAEDRVLRNQIQGRFAPDRCETSRCAGLESVCVLDTSASSEGWHVQWETVPPGKKLAPRSLSHVRGGNETDEAD